MIDMIEFMSSIIRIVGRVEGLTNGFQAVELVMDVELGHVVFRAVGELDAGAVDGEELRGGDADIGPC